MRLRVTSHAVADRGSGLSRIVSTGPMLRNTLVYPPALRVGYLKANRADLLRLGALFRVVATSAHSALHIPVPPAARPMTSLGVDTHPLPLLVARDDAGLRRSDDVYRRSVRRPARFVEHAATIVVTASAELLFWMGDRLTGIGDLAGFFDPEGTDGPMHAFCVVAVDPLFYQARHQPPACDVALWSSSLACQPPGRVI
jgi:hypothetical protein